jgi:hypothetical protein
MRDSWITKFLLISSQSTYLDTELCVPFEHHSSINSNHQTCVLQDLLVSFSSLSISGRTPPPDSMDTASDLDTLCNRPVPSTHSRPTKFLFVNNYSDSRSCLNHRKDKATCSAISSHVQKVRVKAGRHRRRLSHPPLTHLFGWKRKSPDMTPQRRPYVQDRPSQDRRRPQKWDKGRSNSLQGPDEDARCSALALQPSISNPVNPFKCFTALINPWTYSLAKYFETDVLPIAALKHNHLRGVLASRDIAQEGRSLIQGCFVTQVHMIALLACVTSRMKHVSMIRLPRNDMPEYYTVKAIQVLQKHLDRGGEITDHLLRDIHFLATVESYIGNFQAVRTYYKLARYLVTRAGGFDQFAPHVYESLISGDFFLAACTGNPPIFERDRDPGSLTGPWLTNFTGSRLHSALALVDTVLQAIAQDIISYTRVLQHFEITTPKPRSQDLWVYERRSALIHRLLSVPLIQNENKSGHTALKLLQECCRIALLIWTAHSGQKLDLITRKIKNSRIIIPGSATRMRLVFEQVIKYQHEISHPDPALSEEKDVLLLWVAAVGALASIVPDDVDCFERGFLHFAATLGIGTEKALRDMVEGHLPLNVIVPGALSKLSEIFNDAEQHGLAAEEWKTVSRLQPNNLGLHTLQITSGAATWT